MAALLGIQDGTAQATRHQSCPLCFVCSHELTVYAVREMPAVFSQPPLAPLHASRWCDVDITSKIGFPGAWTTKAPHAHVMLSLSLLSRLAHSPTSHRYWTTVVSPPAATMSSTHGPLLKRHRCPRWGRIPAAMLPFVAVDKMPTSPACLPSLTVSNTLEPAYPTLRPQYIALH